MLFFSPFIFLSWAPTFCTYFSTISHVHSTTRLASMNPIYNQENHSFPFVLLLGCFGARQIQRIYAPNAIFFLFLPLVGVQNFDSWRSDDLADGINLRLTRLPK